MLVANEQTVINRVGNSILCHIVTVLHTPSLRLLFVNTLLFLRRRKKKAEEEIPVEEEFMPVIEEEEVFDENPEILNLQGERTRELREMVRAFASENPELSAQQLRLWLNGGEEDGGR